MPFHFREVTLFYMLLYPMILVMISLIMILFSFYKEKADLINFWQFYFYSFFVVYFSTFIILPTFLFLSIFYLKKPNHLDAVSEIQLG